MSEPGGDWLSVAQAAARLGITSRSVQRRCASGSLRARRVPSERGEGWEIDGDSLLKTVATATATHHDGDSGTTATTTATRPKLSAKTTATATAAPATDAATATATGATLDDVTRQLIESQAAQIEFLKGTIEAERRENALTVAALRDAIKAMPKQLTAPDESQASATAPVAPQQPKSVTTVTPSPGDTGAVEWPYVAPDNRPTIAELEAEAPPATKAQQTEPEAAPPWYPPRKEDTLWRRFKVWLVGG
jgi:hypothetical protein